MFTFVPTWEEVATLKGEEKETANILMNSYTWNVNSYDSLE